MNVLFQLHHPAHYHLFKYSIRELSRIGHNVRIVIKEKDVLENLLRQDLLDYEKIGDDEAASRRGFAGGLLKRLGELLDLLKRWEIDLLVGSTADIAILGRYCKIPSYVFFEDDFREVPAYAFLVGPLASKLVCPVSCDAWYWNGKADKYSGYHEIAYLHPKWFIPDNSKILRLYNGKSRYVLLRFSSLQAYHDKGKHGIDDTLATQIITICEQDAAVWIVSERPLPASLEKYRFPLSPSVMHHALAFAHLYAGDSQTMAAEAAVLGTHSIRYNDFVGKLGYLEELEHRYGLTVGVRVGESEKLLSIVKDKLNSGDVDRERMELLYNETVDVTEYIVNMIDGYSDELSVKG